MKRALCGLIVALAAPVSAADEPLGRLFFSPAQRVQLDKARKDRHRAVVPAEPKSSTPLPEHVTVDGIVRRSDGRTTVWLNQRPVNDGRGTDGLPVTGRVRPDGSVRLGIAQGERFVDLKVGQSVEVLSGTIAEPYSRPRTRERTSAPVAATASEADSAKSSADAPGRTSPRRDVDDGAPDQR